MRKLILLAIVSLLSITMFSQTSKTTSAKSFEKDGVFKFITEIVDYGTIKKNSNGKRTFVFKNVGNAPIIINKVKASCGCTVPSKPERPIMPGETAKIDVTYATNRVGSFSKTITISSNASESLKTIKIKGVVLKEE